MYVVLKVQIFIPPQTYAVGFLVILDDFGRKNKFIRRYRGMTGKVTDKIFDAFTFVINFRIDHGYFPGFFENAVFLLASDA